MIRTSFVVVSLACSAHAAVNPGVFGAEVKHAYTQADGLPDDRVTCIAAGGSRVYAGTSKGLASYAAGSWRIEPGFDGKSVDACAAEGKSVLVAYGGWLHRVASGSSSRVATLPQGQPRFIAAGSSAIYFANNRGLFRWLPGESVFSSVDMPVPLLDIRQIALSPTGELAVGAAQGLFVLAGARDWTLQKVGQGHQSRPVVDVRGVAYDSEGRLWFASSEGAGRRDSTGWQIFTGIDGLPEDDFTTMAAGEPGVVWFGTRRGAIRYNGKVWEYRQGLRWLPHDDVRAIAVLPDGSAWFATSRVPVRSSVSR